MQKNDLSWAKNPKYRVAWGIVLLALVALSALRMGGREHFFQALPTGLWSFAKLAAIIWSLMLIQWAMTKTALKRGWTTEERLRRQGEALAHAQKRSLWAALALFFWGIGGAGLLMWWFLNPIPGKPGLAKLNMGRIESSYWFMGLSEAVVLVFVLILGLRWVRSRPGRISHAIFSFAFPLLFLATSLFDRAEPNVVLVIWITSVTLFPTLYIFMLYQSSVKRKFLERGPQT